jgi:hypothetical protein
MVALSGARWTDMVLGVAGASVCSLWLSYLHNHDHI